MRRPGRLVLAVTMSGVLAGCAVDPADVGLSADCGSSGEQVNPLLVLIAQAVPSAELLPCIGTVPSSWRRGDVDVRAGRAAFSFEPSAATGAGRAVLSVVLTAGCDVSGATEVPSDEPGTRRYELLRDVTDGYVGQRFYLYAGGCTTLDFRFPGQATAQQVGQASLAVDLVPRQQVRDGVRERGNGRLELDPPDAP